jgi:uncharacterized protein Yka (UPF0111/DUF47 family)
MHVPRQRDGMRPPAARAMRRRRRDAGDRRISVSAWAAAAPQPANGGGVAIASGEVMATNLDVIERIGDTGLVLPALITAGLAANDRIKFLLTLLQTAAAQAHQPADPAPNLREARDACGIADTTLDDVVGRSRMDGETVALIPGSARIRAMLFDDLRHMLAPIRAIAERDRAWRERGDRYASRLDAAEAATRWDGDGVPRQTIDALTAPGDDAHDTVHRLVMQLHRELNGMLAEVAAESVDGASASGLTEADRPLVVAFMKGVSATAPLKFDHPGLATTAARDGRRLSIQNDLGTTDGHIVVVQIEGLTATVIYSDVHAKRADFMRQLLDRFAIQWQTAGPGAGPGYTMITGRFVASDATALEPFLTALGSRLVFLIDWNRARKLLGRLVRKADAIAILRWAADENVGHCGFLQAGDLRLVFTAFERIAPSRTRYGARLDEVLGADGAIAFLESVLRIAAVGLRARHSVRLIQDEIEAELAACLTTSERGLLETVSDHAMLLSALAERLRAMPGRRDRLLADAARTAAFAKEWETRADDMVRNASRAVDPTERAHVLRRLLTEADEAIDALEEAAFFITLVPDDTPAGAAAPVAGLAELVADSVKEYVRAVAYAVEFCRFRARGDLDHVLLAADHVAELEHACDAAERSARATLVVACDDHRQLHVLAEIVRAFEQAADAVARAGGIVRDYVLAPPAGAA